MNSYDVISYDFTRNDGIVTVKVRPNHSNQMNGKISKEMNLDLLKKKYRCPKTDISSLKTLLKRSYNVREFKEFYRIYGPKLIEIDFGLIELFNLKGQNQFSMEEIQKFNKSLNFIRWGKLFSIAQLQKYKDGLSIQDQIVGLQFYNMLVKERIFTLRTFRYYKNDVERKKFPFQNLYIYDLEDCLQINLQSFQEYLSSFQDQLLGKIKHEEQQLPSLKIQFFQKYFKSFKFENIIAPLFQLKFDEEQQIQLFFVHLSLNGYLYQNNKNEQQEKKYKCYIFVNYDTTYYSHAQLKNGVIEFAHIHNFVISNSDIQFIIDKINMSQTIIQKSNNFLEEYVDYIETQFFLSKTSNERQMNYIFNELPQELSKKPINSILDEKFIIPSNVQDVIKKLTGEDQ